MRSILFLEPRGTVFEVIRAAKSRGYQIITASLAPILLERTPPPYQEGVQAIDHSISVQTWDNPETGSYLLDECKKLGELHGIYSGLDPCAKVLADLREKLGLPTTKPSCIENILDKHVLRNTLFEKGLSKLKTVHSSEVDSWTNWEFTGAGYFKPVHGFFSAYVTRCENFDDLRLAKESWQKGNQSDAPIIKDYLASSKDYHLEEAIEGELLSVEGFSSNGEFKVLGLLSRILFSNNPTVEMGSCFPYPHPLSEKIIEHVRKCHLALGYTDGFSHVEVIVSPKGEVEIIDFNPRFVGADVLQSINNAYGIRIEEALLDWALGKSPMFNPKKSNFACLQYVLPPHEMVVNEVDFPKTQDVVFSTSIVPKGTEVKSTDRQLDYLGCYLTIAPSFQNALRRTKELRDLVKINGTLQGAY